MTKNRNWIVLGVLVAVIAIAVAVAAATSGGDDSNGKATAHETAPVSVDGKNLPQFTGTSNDKAIGDTIPTLQGVTFDGSPVTVEPTGKPQVIVFLSHGCPHCQAEVPRIVALQKAHELSGVEFTAVTTNTSPEFPNYPPSAWLSREHWPFRALADSKKMAAAQAYGLPAFPYFVFVDKDGKVAARATGEIAPNDLAAVVKALAQGQPLVSSSNGQSTAAN